MLIPPGRKLVGARREESQGASNSFNKRRVYPRLLNETGQTRLEWRETQPVTGQRVYAVLGLVGVDGGRKPRTNSPAAFRTRAPFYGPKVEQKVLTALDFIVDRVRPIDSGKAVI